jgi:dienelactone hydrolase
MVELLEASVAHMLAENGRSGSPFENHIRTDHIILMGHSTGGGAAIQLGASRAFNVIAIGLIAPGTGSPGIVNQVSVPLLVLLGTADFGGAGGGNTKLIYDSAPPPKHLVLIDGANHFGYTDAVCIQDGDPPATIARADQQRIAYGYLTAFLQRYVRDIRTYSAYLSGSLSIEGLGSFQISVDSES